MNTQAADEKVSAAIISALDDKVSIDDQNETSGEHAVDKLPVKGVLVGLL